MRLAVVEYPLAVAAVIRFLLRGWPGASPSCDAIMCGGGACICVSGSRVSLIPLEPGVAAALRSKLEKALGARGVDARIAAAVAELAEYRLRVVARRVGGGVELYYGRGRRITLPVDAGSCREAAEALKVPVEALCPETDTGVAVRAPREPFILAVLEKRGDKATSIAPGVYMVPSPCGTFLVAAPSMSAALAYVHRYCRSS